MDILAAFWNLVPITLGQSLMYAFVAIGIMIPFRILDLPDLTCEGSFPLGGCLFAALLAAGLDPFIGTLAATVAGFLAGVATAAIHLRFKVHTLLAGILVFTMLWSVNLRVMGKPNIPLPFGETMFDRISPAILQSNNWLNLAVTLFAGISLVFLVWLFLTERGLQIRCVGANRKLAPSLGINPGGNILLGFGLAGAFVAFGGAVLVQSQGYADVTMGFGILINALAALIIGEALIGRHTVTRQMLAPIVGSIVYYQLVSLGLVLGLIPSDLKFVTGVFVLATLGLPGLFGRKRLAT
jgi:putative ABC transport system permease protein